MGRGSKKLLLRCADSAHTPLVAARTELFHHSRTLRTDLLWQRSRGISGLGDARGVAARDIHGMDSVKQVPTRSTVAGQQVNDSANTGHL
jgi:hypothetical protein